MARLYILLFSFLFISCSVKKQIAKVEISEEIKTEVNTVIKETIKDSIKYDADTYEITIEQKDSLKPVSVVLNGIESTFTNVKYVTIKKKKESLKTYKNELKETVIDSIALEKKEIATVSKDIKKEMDYKLLYPIIFVLIFFILLRIIMKRFQLF
jgi:hypothetical protein